MPTKASQKTKGGRKKILEVRRGGQEESQNSRDNVVFSNEKISCKVGDIIPDEEA